VGQVGVSFWFRWVYRNTEVLLNSSIVKFH